MKIILWLVFFLTFSEMVFYPFPSRSQGFPGSGGAVVMEDSLPVYSANSPESDIARVLKKGEQVWVQIEVTGAEDRWCLISAKEEYQPLGFALCKNLQPLVQESPRDPTAKAKIDEPIAQGDSGVRPPPPEREGAPTYSLYMGSLLQAVWKEDISAVKELLAKGADPNAKSAIGTSPLHGAAKKSEVEITRALIAQGADVNARDQSGLTPLMAAASANQIHNMEALLAAGARVDAKDDKGFTALMWAVVQGFPQGVEVLLENKAQANERSNEGKTALWLSKQILSNTRKSLANAYRKNSQDLIRELRTKVANQMEILNMLKDSGGRE